MRIVLPFLVVFLLSLSSFGQQFCLSCKGTGRTWQKGYDVPRKYIGTERRVVMGKVVYTQKYREAYRVDGKYVTCSRCNGKGNHKSSHTRKKTTQYVKETSSEKTVRVKNKARQIYSRRFEYLGNNYYLGEKTNGIINLLKIENGKLDITIINRDYSAYKRITDLSGKQFIAHSFVKKNTYGKITATHYFDKNLDMIVKSYGDMVPTIYRSVAWIYDKSGTPQLYDYYSNNYINDQKILFPTKQFEKINYYLFYYDLFPVQMSVKDFRGKTISAMGVYNREGKLVVPAKYEKVMNYDNKDGYMALVDKFGLIDSYNAKRGTVYTPNSTIVKKCPNGGVISRVLKHNYATRNANGDTKEVPVYSYYEFGKKSIPYILKSCKCRNSEGNLEVEVYNYGKYMVDGRQRFIPK